MKPYESWESDVKCHCCDNSMRAYSDTLTTNEVDDDGSYVTTIMIVSVLMKCRHCGHAYYNCLK